MILPPLSLVLGGARSGKSTYAEALVAQAAQPVCIATAEALDDEMAARIAHHRMQRAPLWLTVEEPLDLTAALVAHAKPGRAVLVDCLTLWLSNLMMAQADVEKAVSALLDALPGLEAPVVFVANEVGLGIVPGDAGTRRFRDHAGRLNQRLAASCQSVTLMVAGLPLALKSPI